MRCKSSAIFNSANTEQVHRTQRCPKFFRLQNSKFWNEGKPQTVTYTSVPSESSVHLDWSRCADIRFFSWWFSDRCALWRPESEKQCQKSTSWKTECSKFYIFKIICFYINFILFCIYFYLRHGVQFKKERERGKPI